MTATREQASAELAESLVNVTQEAVLRHGISTDTSLIVSASYFAVISAIDSEVPGFKALIMRMLAEA